MNREQGAPRRSPWSDASTCAVGRSDAAFACS